MIARLKLQGKEWAVQIGYNPANLVCRTTQKSAVTAKIATALHLGGDSKTLQALAFAFGLDWKRIMDDRTTSIQGYYEVRLWPTREQAEQWATKHRFEIEQEAQ